MKMEYRQIGQAELKVDCYAGKSFDQHKPLWHGFFDGDMDDGQIGNIITLNTSNFKPGTRVLILEPVCPKCNQSRALCEPFDKCCFDWITWDEEQYS